MTITVIIATCNRPDRLVLALDAVRAAIEASGEPHAIVVADNGTHAPARAVTEQLAQAAPGLNVRYRRTEPFNKAAALNAAIGAADTEWLAFTDDDCLPDRGWLKAGADFAASSGINVFSGRLQAAPFDFPLPRWLPPRSGPELPWSPAFVDFAPLPASGILEAGARVPFGANIFVRKWVFDTYGGYDEDLWKRCGRAALGSEDAEFGMRVRNRGEAIGYCADALVVHPVYPERTTMAYYLKHILHAGMREPLFTDPGQRASTPYLCKSMLVSAAKSAVHYARGRHVDAMRTLMDATRDVGEIWGWARLRRRGPQ